MTLAEKLRALREQEGRSRGLGRPLTKADVSRMMRAELGRGISQAYLSQLETGARVHLSAHTRTLLARFYRVHPGYLVDDTPASEPDGAVTDRLTGWLRERAQEFQDAPLVAHVLTELSAHADPRRYLDALARLMELLASEFDDLLRRGFRVETEPARTEWS